MLKKSTEWKGDRNMEIYEAIEKRRTIRRFKAPATGEQIMRIIVAGTKAPSGGNQQRWEFILVDDPALIEKISERKYVLNRGNKPRGEAAESPEKEKGAQVQKESFANASLIAVYFKEGGIGDAWMCLENMSLAAVAEGLGTRIAIFGMGADKDINQILKVPTGFDLAAVLSVGVPAMEPAPRKLRAEESWLHRNQF
jgi:nitroreductase